MTWEGQACHKHFFSFFPPLVTFHNFTSNVSRQPFLLTSHSPHPLPSERCKVNISIGLQWPVSTALIPTLLFEGSIVPDLLAWFACLWIMAEEPQSGLLPIEPFLLMIGPELKTYMTYFDIRLWSRSPRPYTTWTGMHCMQRFGPACPALCTVKHWLRYSIPVSTQHVWEFPRYPALLFEQRQVILRSGSYNFVVPHGPSCHQSNSDMINWCRGDFNVQWFLLYLSDCMSLG